MEINDRLTREAGTFYLPAMQALVRLPLEQMRRDRRQGLRTAAFISGYPGSPIAGYDLALERAGSLLADHDVVLQRGGNEEQAATALMGTQMLDRYAHTRYDGVVGYFYGKGPGVDRSGDALKHGNFAGTSQHGAVVVLSGEDHDSTSSTMPHQQDYAFMSAGIPILYPTDVADIRRLGLHAAACSRYSGCWMALKLTSAVCDSGQTVTIDSGDVPVTLPELEVGGRPFAKRTDFTFFPGKNIAHEQHLYEERHPAVLAYARANGLDRVTVQAPGDEIGVITAGKSAADVRQSLLDMGLDRDALHRAGVRILELGLIWPLDRQVVQAFAADLRTVVVVEEKRDVVEAQVKQALQEVGSAARVLGKRSAEGQPMLPSHGGFGADEITGHLAPLLRGRLEDTRGIDRRLAALRPERAPGGLPLVGSRTPNYCSGCPHSASTVLADGQTAWGSPGCHAFATTIEQPHRQINTMTQLGGEGLPWVGLAPFTDQPHIVQNVGDGSLYHSSYANIRWAAAIGLPITFKILFNGFVANTGAQPLVGANGVPALLRSLAGDGVARIALVTKEPDRYRRAGLPDVVELHDPTEVAEVGAALAEVTATTVLLYDESCANERRRQRKRGLLPASSEHVMINTAVCEACGDCGEKSNCMSLQKVSTELGPKTQVHHSSCNTDFSCLAGNCPSFVTVHTEDGRGYASRSPAAIEAADLPDAHPAPLAEPFRIALPGVGGTGVLTLNAILAFAAMAEGYHARTYDQTGAAQKWGAVLSNLVLTPPGTPVASHKIGARQTDLLLALDDLSSVSGPNQQRCDPGRTAVVVNTDTFPTGEMIRDPFTTAPTAAVDRILQTIARPDGLLRVPARRIAEELFDDWMLTNVVAVGAACQAGLLPLSAKSIEAAIELNGVAVQRNLQAFRHGRLWAADADRVLALLDPPVATAQESAAAATRRLGADAAGYRRLLARADGAGEELRRLLAFRLAALVEYQDLDYAERYLTRVLEVAEVERRVAGQDGPLAETVARRLHKVMAYKDEYEVARLLTDPAFEAEVRETFDGPVRLSYNLLPPAVRSLGRSRKVRLGPAFRPVLVALRRGKRLRGTRFDPFARQASRVEERAILTWYEDLLDRVLACCSIETMATCVELADLPDRIRGYEEVKTAGFHAASARADELLKILTK